MINRIFGLLERRRLARAKRRWSGKEPPAFAADRLVLDHLDFGSEEFVVPSSSFNLYPVEDGTWELVIRVETGEVTRASELQEVAGGSPSFEATALLSEGGRELEPGTVVLQREGYDSIRGENLSAFSYVTHENVEELRIEVVSLLPEGAQMRVTGACVVNGSLLTSPDARFSVETVFRQDFDLRRGIR